MGQIDLTKGPDGKEIRETLDAPIRELEALVGKERGALLSLAAKGRAFREELKDALRELSFEVKAAADALHELVLSTAYPVFTQEQLDEAARSYEADREQIERFTRETIVGFDERDMGAYGAAQRRVLPRSDDGRGMMSTIFICSPSPLPDEMDYQALQRDFAPALPRGPINRNAWHLYNMSAGRPLCGISLGNPEIFESDAEFTGEYIRYCSRCGKAWTRGKWWERNELIYMARQVRA